MKKTILFFLLFMGVSGLSFAQNEPQHCNTTVQFHEDRMQSDSNYRKHVERHQEALKKMRDEGRRNPSCVAGPVIIPVAVHFDSGIVPAGQEACAIAIAEEHLAVLNAEFAGLDPDAGTFSNFSCFGTTVGESCLEFCLATENHPTGYGLTNGDPAVTFGEINFNNTAGGGSGVPKDVNWAGYLNIFVDNLGGGLLGEAAGIPGDFSGEGVIVDDCTFGSGNETPCTGMNSTATCATTYDEGETLTHEVGHYMGLFHIWGDNSTCTGAQDQIADTPNMDDSYSGYTGCGNHTQCSQLPTSCSSEDMYMNYMSYASDGCMYMFTSDQADVMYTFATNSGFDENTPTVCAPAMAPVAAISSTTGNVCEYGCISFIDDSTNNPDTWSWTFTVTSGDITLDAYTSTDQNPLICTVTGTSGTIQADLTVSNSSGSDMTTGTLAVTVDNTCVDGCYSYLNIDLNTDNLTLYTSTTGFVAGSNNYDDESKAEFYDLVNEGLCYPSQLTGVSIYFAGQDGSPTGTLDVIVWDNTGTDGNGNGGAPGAVLGSATINVSDVLTDITNNDLTYVDFSSAPITINTPYFVGVKGFNSTLSGGNLGLVTNTDPETTPSTAWEEWNDGSWYAFDDASSWELDIAQVIIPFILPEQPTATFTEVGAPYCDDGTSYTFTNTSNTTMCSGTTATYAWTLRDGTGGVVSTATTANATFSFTSAGSYDVEMCIIGANCETDCSTISITVTTCGTSCYSLLDNSNGLATSESGVADYESSDWISTSAPTTIQNGASVDYDATDYIELNAGFEVKQGAVFQAFIDGCDMGGGGVNLQGGNPNNSLMNRIRDIEVKEVTIEHEKSCTECNLGRNILQRLKEIAIDQIETASNKKG